MKNGRLTVALCVSMLAAAGSAWAEAPAAPRVQLPLGAPAPEILATTVDGQAVTLASLRGKPVVLEFGSITEPWFRARVPAVEKLAAKYKDRAAFVIVYQRESHGADTANAIEENDGDGYAIAAPTSQDERYKLAEQARDRLHLDNETLVVDAWSNTTSLRYGGYPNMAFVIDAEGKLQAGYPWMDPAKAQRALDALLAGKAVPEDARGPVHGGSAGTDYENAAMEMTGYAQGARLAMILDKIQMTDEQKRAVLPPLLQFMADLRDFRQTRGGGPPAKAGANTAGSAGDKVISADDLQTALQKLRASAQKLKDACTANLSDKDAKQIIDALDQGPAHRLFADN